MTYRVGVNLLWLRPNRVGGSEQYLVRQLSALLTSEIGSDFSVTLFVAPGFSAAHSDLVERAHTVVAPVAGNRGLRILAESTWLGFWARRLRLDLVHHGGGTVPIWNPMPCAVTIHDLQVYSYPSYFSGPRRHYLRWSLPRAVRRARVVLTPSAYVRQTVISELGALPERVRVVPHGLVESDEEQTPVEELRAIYDLPGAWVLYPAMTHPHKNHEVLAQAAAQMANRFPTMKFVLTGASGSAEVDLMRAIQALGVSDRFRRLGRVPYAHLNGLYAGATACVFPSRYEGFGAPVLEAMRRGCPVIASNVTALEEVLADAAVLLDPTDASAWSEAICRLAESETERARLKQLGIVRSQSFTGDAMAEALGKAYRYALGASK